MSGHKHRQHRWRALTAAGFALVLALAACTGDDGSESTTGGTGGTGGVTSQTGGEPRLLRVATTANVTTWDPILSFSTEALYMANVYEGLLRVNPEGSEEQFEGVLAESWESSSDGLTWTFHLREGVTFHDGEPLTADAVTASFEAAKERGGASFIWLPLKKARAVDDLTVELQLSYAAPVDLIAASTYGAWIVSPRALEAAAADDQYFEQGIAAGTGPYTLASYTPDEEIVLERFDDYWGGWDGSRFDTVLLQIVPEATQQQQMLDGGEVDLALRMPVEATAEYADREGYTLLSEPSWFSYLAFFNTTRPPLDDPLVRQALSYAVPYDDVIQIATLGLATQARGPVPLGVFPYSEAVSQYHQDLDRARELLAEAGHPGGGFSLRLTYAAENDLEERFVPVLRDAFADVGVDLEIEPILFNQQWEQAKADPGQAQDIFVLLYWPTYADAGSDNLWSLFHSSEAPFFNLSYWSNAEYDAMVDEAGTLTATDREGAQELYAQAMSLLVEEAPALFLFDAEQPYVVPDYIQGFQYNPNYPFSLFFYEMTLVA